MKRIIAIISALTLGLGINATALAQNPIPEGSVAEAVDTQFPSDVENVKAEPGDAKAKLTWDAATDNTGVKGYKIFYGPNTVTEEGGSYTMGPVDTGNVVSYEITGLENGKTYYFAVTAYDMAGNESEFYSNEAMATPNGATTDKTAPTVVSAEAVNSETVSVVFSEAVTLPPTNAASAFGIKNDATSTALEVKNAAADATDLTGKTVLLMTAPMDASANYILTAGIDVKDQAANPIVSGTSDTAVFKGSDKPVEELKPAAQEDKTAPAFVSVKALDTNSVEITFSESVVLKADARENFVVTDAADSNKIVNISKVTLGATGMLATLTTDSLENKQYNLIAVGVKDSAGNEMDVNNNATTFTGVAASVTDNNGVVTQMLVNAAKDLMAEVVSTMAVKLSWSADETKLADIANFVVYMSTDKGTTWGEGMVLGKDVTNYSFENLTAGMMYYFKLTSRDANGNESEGITTFLSLPATGPELGLLLLGSLGAGAFANRKKK